MHGCKHACIYMHMNGQMHAWAMDTHIHIWTHVCIQGHAHTDRETYRVRHTHIERHIHMIFEYAYRCTLTHGGKNYLAGLVYRRSRRCMLHYSLFGCI